MYPVNAMNAPPTSEHISSVTPGRSAPNGVSIVPSAPYTMHTFSW
jgi:hypothetical protein